MVHSDLLKEHGFKEEIREEVTNHYAPTGFPKSLKSYRLVYEVYDLSIEETYFWVLKHLRYDLGFPVIDKTEDTFAAAEGSAFFGVMQQRLGLQQDKISQFLATIGKMVKELFQLVRELRILDERTAYYNEAEEQRDKPFRERRKGAEITLKGMFIDLVQGGAKSAASVYGMARELEFTVLPDLFFDAPPFKSGEEMERYVNNLEFNNQVLRVLKRHLRQFFEWKKRTYSEVKTRRIFTLQYLRQHYDIIKMYMEWAKPYLRNVDRMTTKQKHMTSPDIVMSFEGSMIDIELLASRPYGQHNACVLATFNYRTRPSMKFQQEGYQRGPVHIGKMEMNLRAYVWTKEQMEAFKKMKEKEGMDLLKTVSGSVKSAMDALGEELFDYLEEAGEAKKEKETSQPDKKSLTEKMFGDFMTPKEVKAKKKKIKKIIVSEKGRSEATGFVKLNMFLVYKNFKKSHRMIMW
ncbi:hypothetical protein GOV03_01165 [Candidatus Woesearchaeota archaeon]|nr:hypothetical protein [Candidatus Woesearchaeota archaeon]